MGKVFFRLRNLLHPRLGSKAMIDKGDELADGIDQTIDLLSSIDTKESYVNSQLLWDYAKWVLLKDPYRGIKVFYLLMY